MREVRPDPDADLLLVTRNYPPMVGGLEQYAADLHTALAKRIDIELLANRVGVRGLPAFLPRVLWHLVRHRHRYRRIHFADTALAPVAWLARLITGSPATVTAHALDVIYPNGLYQWIVPWSLRRLDGVVSVSRFTRDACMERGVDPLRCRVIPNGIGIGARDGGPDSEDGVELLPRGLEGKRVLTSVGRLVPRKGVAWFVAEVMPQLGDEYVYLIGGAGEQREEIVRAIVEHGLQDRVHLLGSVDEPRKRALLKRADLFMMPNVPVIGDAEGFGISVIEATWRGVPAIVADLEGLRDAVIDGVTGLLVAPRDAAAWRTAITAAEFDRSEVVSETRARFDWDRLVDDYLEFFGLAPARESGA